jgi:hypothetical protein
VSMTTKEYIVSHSAAASHTNSGVMRERLSRSHKCIVSGELMVETDCQSELSMIVHFENLLLAQATHTTFRTSGYRPAFRIADFYRQLLVAYCH